MKKTIVINNAWGDVPKQRHEAESRAMVKFLTEIKKGSGGNISTKESNCKT